MTADVALSAWSIIQTGSLTDETALVQRLVAGAALDAAARAAIVTDGADLVKRIRASARPGLMEVFLAEYGLSTDEGIALMCLAEALLRVPDAETMDALIEDKIAPSDWGRLLRQLPLRRLDEPGERRHRRPAARLQVHDRDLQPRRIEYHGGRIAQHLHLRRQLPPEQLRSRDRPGGRGQAVVVCLQPG